MTLYILDSDHLSLYQRGHEALLSHLLITPPDQLAITVISVEELIRGRLAQIRSANDSQTRVRAYYWLMETLDFLCNFTVLPYDAESDKHFDRLQKQKIRIGTQDMRIAAITLRQQATLLTRNQQDFGVISGLQIANWS